MCSTEPGNYENETNVLSSSEREIKSMLTADALSRPRLLSLVEEHAGRQRLGAFYRRQQTQKL